MEAELQHGLAMCEAEVMAFIEPLEQVRPCDWHSRCCEYLCVLCQVEVRAVIDAVAAALFETTIACFRRPGTAGVELLGIPFPATPSLQLTAAEVRRLEAAEAARADLVGSLDRLKQRVANVE